ncbi:hypothetical protein PTE30175_02825 [Pandoraea terrae]|uniref:Uncharacterized protein n=1 Tax=Pandoraea terrae TaxID=1537710 RepID=A0A5E4VWL1_9BURK|nr:hypothetical protein PTE30175_02825 [Pandoraea terrae]
MVLVGDGRAEQRENAVAQELGDVALIVVHGLHHKRHDRVDQAPRLFGIQVLDQRR